MASETRKRQCRGCVEKQLVIDNLLNRLSSRSSSVEVDGPSLIEQMGAKVDSEDEDIVAEEQKRIETSKLFMRNFVKVHTADPYANCLVVTESSDG